MIPGMSRWERIGPREWLVTPQSAIDRAEAELFARMIHNKQQAFMRDQLMNAATHMQQVGLDGRSLLNLQMQSQDPSLNQALMQWRGDQS